MKNEKSNFLLQDPARRVYVALLLGLLLLTPISLANAGSFVDEWRSCHQSCNIVADQCLFLNGIDTCEGSRLACKADCDVAYPTMNVCVGYCEATLAYCSASPSSSGTCGRHNRTCLASCEGRVAARLP